MACRLLASLAHPNIIRLYGTCTDDKGDLCMVLEYAPHGTLYTRIHTAKDTDKGSLPFLELMDFALQIAQGNVNCTYYHAMRPVLSVHGQRCDRPAPPPTTPQGWSICTRRRSSTATSRVRTVCKCVCVWRHGMVM
jgi:serine/threonine protein kinase